MRLNQCVPCLAAHGTFVVSVTNGVQLQVAAGNCPCHYKNHKTVLSVQAQVRLRLVGHVLTTVEKSFDVQCLREVQLSFSFQHLGKGIRKELYSPSVVITAFQMLCTLKKLFVYNSLSFVYIINC